MASQAWQLAGEIVRAALKRPLHERAAYLAAACAGNDALRQEVELFLRYYQQPEMHSGSLLNSPSKRKDAIPAKPNAPPSTSPQPHPLTQVPAALKPNAPPSTSETPPASPTLSNFNASTVRIGDPRLAYSSDTPTTPTSPFPPAGDEPRKDTTVTSKPASVAALMPALQEKFEAEETGPLDWLARLTEEDERQFESESKQSLIIARPVSPGSPAASPSVQPISQPVETMPLQMDVTELLPVPPPKQRDTQEQTPGKASGFEQLFKRVTLPPPPPAQSSVTTPSTAPATPPPAAASPPVTPAAAPLSSGSGQAPPARESRQRPAQTKPGMNAPPGVAGRLNSSDSFTSAAKTLDGRMLGPYQLLYELGRGGMGRVYLAEDTRLGRRVALKMLLRSSTRSPERVRRFEQEARAASSLNHPNILTIHEIGEIKGVHYLATEFVEGFTLHQVIERGGLTLTKILDIGVQIANALAAAHDANIVHRDIKPENLMVRMDGYIKVLDFGIAKLLEKDTTPAHSQAPEGSPTTDRFNTESGVIIGTADYMSPEQARGLRVDNRTDIFSLGVVLYEMVTGVRPFTGATPTDVVAALLTREPVPVTHRLAGAPGALHRILQRALTKDRDQRYRSARDLAKDLKALRQDLELATRAAQRPAQSPAPRPTPTGQSPQPGTAQRPMPAAGKVTGPSDARPTSRAGGAPQPPPRPANAPRQAAPHRPSPNTPPPNMPLPNRPPPGAQPTGQRPAASAQPPPPRVATADKMGPVVNQPSTFAGFLRVPSRTHDLAQNKVNWWPWILLLCCVVGLGAGIWANYYRLPEVDSIAIMPFTATRLSGGNAPVASADEEALRLALAEGLHESLLQRLAPLPKLRVIARNSVRNLRKGLEVSEVGSALEARNVLTGRLVARGNAVTVSLELFDTVKGQTLWSQRYERTISDLHLLPEILSPAVVEQLPLRLNAVQNARLARRETNQAEAFQSYLKGRYLWQQRQPETIKASIQYLRHAIELDANYARAYAALAESYVSASLYGIMPMAEAVLPGRVAADQALQLDGQLSEAYRVQGFWQHQFDWNFTGAEKAYQRAIELNPNFAVAHQEYGGLLTSLRRFDEGVREAQAAAVLDPLSSASLTNVGAAYYYAGRYQEAVDACLAAKAFNQKAAGAYKYLGLAYQQILRLPEALDAMQKAVAFAPRDLELKGQLAGVLAHAGQRAEAQKLLESLRALPAHNALAQYRLATIYAALDDKEHALAALTQAVAKREPGVIWLKVDPQLNALRKDQRFQELLKQIGLP